MPKTDKFIYEVFDLINNETIGFVKAVSYESAVEEAFARYQRPVDLVYHDQYTEQLRSSI